MKANLPGPLARQLGCLCLVLFWIAACSTYKSDLPSPMQKSEDIIVFQNVNLVPMTEEKIIENQIVIVKGKRILEIGSSNEVVIPEKAHIIDGTGCYLMPGLADLHAHIRVKSTRPLKLYLANGVTAIRNMDATEGPLGGAFILDWRSEIEAEQRIGPMIYTAGPIIRGYPDEYCLHLIDDSI